MMKKCKILLYINPDLRCPNLMNFHPFPEKLLFWEIFAVAGFSLVVDIADL